MEDDIDIEEHDVMDNPYIKKIFPDISIVKEELLEYSDVTTFEKGITSTTASEINQNADLDSVNLDVLHSVAQAIVLDDNTTSKTTRQGNHITFSSMEDLTISGNGPPDAPILSNKIILGSKPIVESGCVTQKYSKIIPQMNAKVQICNIDSFIKSCKRYCSRCLILFPTVEKFWVHEYSEHTLLKGKKHHGIIKKLVNKKGGPTNSCFHCNKGFASRKQLIEHIYKVLHEAKNKNPEKSIIWEKSNILDNELKNVFEVNEDAVQLNVSCSNMEKPVRLASSKNEFNIKKDNVENDKINKLYFRCWICFCFYRTTKYYSQHMKFYHNITLTINEVTEDNKVAYRGECLPCHKKLPDLRSYNEHMKIYHCGNVRKRCSSKDGVLPEFRDSKRSKGEYSEPGNGNLRNIKKLKTKPVYKLERNTSEVSNSKDRNQSSLRNYNIQDKKMSKRKYTSASHNDGTSVVSMLQSSLFKCVKCEIYFLSAKLAVCHSEHLELVNNWKCSVCSRIFKIEDSATHLKQHTEVSQFNIYNMCGTNFHTILFKCPTCGIHFNEDGFHSHYFDCESEQSSSVDSSYCLTCDILIDAKAMNIHKKFHEEDHLNASDFTIVEHVDKLAKKRETTILNNTEQVTRDSISYKKRKLASAYDLSYCNKCKCFITNRGRKILAHVDGRCVHIPKTICKSCGLILTCKVFSASHKKLHMKHKDLKLNDFTFYDESSGNLIKPPIPEYPKCNICEIHFISAVAVANHMCSETIKEYLTCPLCDVKYTEAAFKFHMSFHNYSLSENSNLRNPTNIECMIKTPSTSTIYEINESKQENTQRDLQLQENVSQNKNGRDAPKLSASEIILFVCMKCCTTLDTYDTLIEHCQDHYTKGEINIVNQLCSICDLHFEKASYERHMELHNEKGREKEAFKIVNCDIFYFASSNETWIKQSLGTLSEVEKRDILSNSIYKDECRLKFNVIQNGSTDIVVYKCGSCSTFVDPTTVYKHAENSCFKVKKNPCSFCGLPFNSSASKVIHEEVHKLQSKICYKSYTVVVFNNQDDKILNKRMSIVPFYIMHQCRICGVSVEKSVLKSHTYECGKFDTKKCPICRLSFYTNHYNSHLEKHERFESFSNKYMKIMLFGRNCPTQKERDKDIMYGEIIDHSLYRCLKCQTCVKRPHHRSKHICPPRDQAKAKCQHCDLYFCPSGYKIHLKIHEIEPELTGEHINIIDFNLPISRRLQSQKAHTTVSAEERLSTSADSGARLNRRTDLNKDDDDSAHNDNDVQTYVVEMNAKLFKCACGLHFVDLENISKHLYTCNPKMKSSKQSCAKCDLLFNPKELFDHMVAHHGNKKYTYKFDIVNICTEKNIVFKCVKCELHFTSASHAKAHLTTCNEIGKVGKLCGCCNLLFHTSTFESAKHISGKGCNVINIPDCTKERKYHSSTFDEIISQADLVNGFKSNTTPVKMWRLDVKKYTKMYKCVNCDVIFLTKTSINDHYHKGKHILQRQTICQMCGLNFYASVLQKHIYLHHQKLNFKKVDIINVKYDEATTLKSITESSETNSTKLLNEENTTEESIAETSETINAKLPTDENITEETSTQSTETISAKLLNEENTTEESIAENSETISAKLPSDENITEETITQSTETISAKLPHENITEETNALSTETISAKLFNDEDITEESFTEPSETISAMFSNDENTTQASITLSSFTISAKLLTDENITEVSIAESSEMMSAKLLSDDSTKKESISKSCETFGTKSLSDETPTEESTSEISETISAKLINDEKSITESSETISAKLLNDENTREYSITKSNETISVKLLSVENITEKNITASSETMSGKLVNEETTTEESIAESSETISAKLNNDEYITEDSIAEPSKTISAKFPTNETSTEESFIISSDTISAKWPNEEKIMEVSIAESSETISATLLNEENTTEESIAEISETTSAKLPSDENITKEAITQSIETLSAKLPSDENITEKTSTQSTETISAMLLNEENTAEESIAETSETISAKLPTDENITEETTTQYTETISAKLLNDENTSEESIAETSETVSAKLSSDENIAEETITQSTETISAKLPSDENIMEVSIAESSETISATLLNEENTTEESIAESSETISAKLPGDENIAQETIEQTTETISAKLPSDENIMEVSIAESSETISATLLNEENTTEESIAESSETISAKLPGDENIAEETIAQTTETISAKLPSDENTMEETTTQSTETISAKLLNEENTTEESIAESSETMSAKLSSDENIAEETITQSTETISAKLPSDENIMEVSIAESSETISATLLNEENTTEESIAESSETISAKLPGDENIAQETIEQTTETISAKLPSDENIMEVSIAESSETISATLLNEENTMEESIAETSETISAKLPSDENITEETITQSTETISAKLPSDENEETITQSTETISAKLPYDENITKESITEPSETISAMFSNNETTTKESITMSSVTISAKWPNDENITEVSIADSSETISAKLSDETTQKESITKSNGTISAKLLYDETTTEESITIFSGTISAKLLIDENLTEESITESSETISAKLISDENITKELIAEPSETMSGKLLQDETTIKESITKSNRTISAKLLNDETTTEESTTETRETISAKLLGDENIMEETISYIV